MSKRKPRVSPEGISLALKALYDAVTSEAVPQSFHDLIRRAK